MRMQVIFVGEYELDEDWQEFYDTPDPSEVARIDAKSDPRMLFEDCDRIAIVSIVPEPSKPESG